MEITEVRVSPSRGGKVRAFVSLVIDDCFIVNDLRVLEGREGQLFVTMPSRKTRNGQVRDIAHPLNSATREMVEERILSEYSEAVGSRVVPQPSSARGHAQGKDKGSAIDRLATRLFVEEFWAPEDQQRDGADG